MSIDDLEMIRKTIKFNEDPHITDRLNKKNLHKWNISKRTGFYIILNIITNILKESSLSKQYNDVSASMYGGESSQ